MEEGEGQSQRPVIRVIHTYILHREGGCREPQTVLERRSVYPYDETRRGSRATV